MLSFEEYVMKARYQNYSAVLILILFELKTLDLLNYGVKLHECNLNGQWV